MSKTYTIYQLKKENESVKYHFWPYSWLQKEEEKVNGFNYEKIYTAPLTSDMTLDTIYEQFNINHPEDFTGHSLSVSDVVVLMQDGITTAYYVDSIGFVNVTKDFMQAFL